jgi:hypothetical protein
MCYQATSRIAVFDPHVCPVKDVFGSPETSEFPSRFLKHAVQILFLVTLRYTAVSWFPGPTSDPNKLHHTCMKAM